MDVTLDGGLWGCWVVGLRDCRTPQLQGCWAVGMLGFRDLGLDAGLWVLQGYRIGHLGASLRVHLAVGLLGH